MNRGVSVKELRERLQEATARADYYESCFETFFTGDIPESASLNHLILAKYGRQRLKDLAQTPALLKPETSKQPEEE